MLNKITATDLSFKIQELFLKNREKYKSDVAINKPIADTRLVLSEEEMSALFRDLEYVKLNEHSIDYLIHVFKIETMGSSRTEIKHWAYQELMEIGAEVVPYVMKDMIQNGAHWFHLLREVTGITPIGYATARPGVVDDFKKAWLEWYMSQPS